MKSILLAVGSQEDARIAREAVSPLVAATGATVRLPDGEPPRWVDAVVEDARRTGPELVVFVPHAGAEAGPAWLDPAAMRLASEIDGAVLVLRRDAPWPPMRTLLPAGRSEIEDGTVPRAWSWLRTLGGAPGRDAPPDAWRLDVLHLARDADEWHDGGRRLAEQVGPPGAAPRMRRLSCMRFGAPARKRVLDCLRAESVDLLVLPRERTAADDAGGGALDWLRVFAHARCPVLLLPRPGATPPGPAGAALPGWRRLAGWVRGGERLPAPA